MNIETLVEIVVDPFRDIYFNLRQTDRKSISGLWETIQVGAVTDKQAALILKILNKNVDVIKPVVPDVESHLVQPSWSSEIFVTSTEKRAFVKDGMICVSFPYDDVLVAEFRKRNADSHSLFRGIWNPNERYWTFKLLEANVTYLSPFLKRFNFKIESSLSRYVDECDAIINSLGDYIPMICYENGKYIIKNASEYIPLTEFDDVATAAVLGRTYGVFVYDDLVSSEIKSKLHPVTRAYIDHNQSAWVNRKTYDDSCLYAFDQLIGALDHIAIVIPGGSEIELVKLWHEHLVGLGYTSEQLSVTFKMPRSVSAFNTYVSEHKLSNLVTSKTKVAFIRNQVPKPLITSGVKFDLVIDMGNGIYTNQAMKVFITESFKTLQYTNTKPSH